MKSIDSEKESAVMSVQQMASEVITQNLTISVLDIVCFITRITLSAIYYVDN